MSNIASLPAPQASPGALVESTETYRITRLVALLPGMALGLIAIWSSSVVVAGQRYFTLLDDALISLTYARTLARTGELVWFPGAERVEGFTNPGYTLIMAIPHWLGLSSSDACLAMSLFGLATVLVTSFIAGGVAIGLHRSRLVAFTTTLTVSCSFPLLYWSLFGLEAGMVALLLIGMLALAFSAPESGPSMKAVVGMALLAGAAVLVRPDAAVIALVVGVWVILHPSGASKGTGRWTRAVILGIGILGTLAVITVTRWFYYGALTPNTYDLKIGNSGLFERVSRAWVVDTEVWWLLGAAALAVCALWLRSDADRSRTLLLCAVASVQVLYTFYIGGDTFHPDRFLTPVTLVVTVLVIPAVVVLPRQGMGAVIAATLAALGLAIVCWRTLPQPWSLGALLPLLALTVLLIPGDDRLARVVPVLPLGFAVVGLTALTAGNTIVGYLGWLHYGAALSPLDRLGMQRHHLVREFTTPEAVVGVFGAGAIPYWVERPAVDILGKSDRVIARQARRDRFVPGHDKWDYQRSLIELQPDIVDADLLDPNNPVLAGFPARVGELEAIAKIYQRRCLADGSAVLVRRDSTAVDRSQFVPCPPIPGSTGSPGNPGDEAALPVAP